MQVRDVFDRMIFETADLDVDRQHAVVGAAGEAMPFVGNQPALGKQFEKTRGITPGSARRAAKTRRAKRRRIQDPRRRKRERTT
jgi:hypothetical protein